MAVAKHTIEGDEVEWKAKIVEVADKRRVRRIKEALANPRKELKISCSTGTMVLS